MLQKLRRPVAFVSAVAMTLTMLLYLPVGVFTNNDYGMWANAEENRTTTTTTVKLSDEDNGFFGKEYQEAEKITKQNYKEYGFTADNWKQFEDYYAVENAGQLYWIAQLVNEHGETDFNVVLTDDIVVNYDVLNEYDNFNYDPEDTYREWTPIDYYYDKVNDDYLYYTGTFDGNGHTISGLIIIQEDTGWVVQMGLFNNLDGTVKNLGVIDSYFSSEHNGSSIGVICETLGDNGLIENCYNKGTIFMSGLANYVGGICAKTYGGTIKDCYNEGLIWQESDSTSSTSTYIGGICGYIVDEDDEAGALIDGCYNTGNVIARGKRVYAGGICGCSSFENNVSKITNCYNKGSIDVWADEGYIGGICGLNENIVENCYNTEFIQGRGYTAGLESAYGAIGGICGYLGGYGDVHAYIENCYNTDDGGISADINGYYLGGICGNSRLSYIYNCYNHGAVDITNAEYGGGIVGIASGTISCCYNTGLLSGDSDYSQTSKYGQIGGYLTEGTTAVATKIEGCFYSTYYHDDDIGFYGTVNGDVDIENIGSAYMDEAFNSGNIAYLLQMAQEADDNGEVPQVWGQTIMGDKKDDYPVLGGKKIYFGTSCKGDDSSLSSSSFSNFEFDNDGHSYDDNGFCVFCDGYEPAVLVTFRNEESLGLPSLNYRDCYAIQNAGNLYWFAQQVNAGNTDYKAVLLNDIVVNENVLNSDGTLNTTNSANFRTWEPIGNTTIGYNASFEGNWHTISGLYINGYTGYFGLFGNAGASAHIRNIGVEDSYFNGTGVAGGIVGGLTDGYVNSCYTRCYVNASSTSVTIAGGIIGAYSADSAGHLYGCYSESYVYATNAGAIIGQNLSGADGFDSCYYNSDICSNAIGVGQSETTKIEGHSSENFKNGVVASKLGDNGIGQKLTGDDKDDYPKFNAPRVYENYICTWQYFYSNDEYKDDSHVYENGFCKFCNDGYESATLITEDNYKDFDLTSGYVGYYAIENAGQLYWFANYANGENQSANAVLTDNIVVNKSVLKSDGTLADDTSNFIEWFPIGYYYDRDGNGTYEDVCYNGTFDGQGYTISGLYFNNTNQGYVGLFGQIESGAKVQNVGVIDSYFCAEKHVGGVCGDNNESTVTNCYFSGSVLTISGSFIGGVCGNNRKGTITNCYNIGSVLTTSGGHIGGVCGYNYGTIANCYYSGSVAQYATTAGASSAGGLCGYNYNGTITNSYYLSATSTTDGGKTEAQFKSGEVAYLLQNGQDSEDTIVWGQRVIGKNKETRPVFGGKEVFQNKTYTTCYVDENSASYSYSNVKIADVFSTNHSELDDDGFCKKCGGYQSATLVTSENFEELNLDESYVDFYAISNAGQLYWFADKVNNENDDYADINVVLIDDIVVNKNVLNTDGTLNTTNSSTFRKWTPIGNYDNDTDFPFVGIFNGNNHTISGLYYDGSDINAGLFGYLDYNDDSSCFGLVTNVGVIDSYFKLTGTDDTVYYSLGAICGDNDGAIIDSCYSNSTVCATGIGFIFDISGICGYNECDVIYSYNTGKISADTNAVSDTYVSGVVGCNLYGLIDNCYNSGKITSTAVGGYQANIGGIAGYNGDCISNSYNTGEISASGTPDAGQIVGGVNGYNDGRIINCYNTGNINATSTLQCVGGFIGENENGVIVLSYSTGKITTSDNMDDICAVGGFCGYNGGGIGFSKVLDAAYKTAVGEISTDADNASLATTNEKNFASGCEALNLNSNKTMLGSMIFNIEVNYGVTILEWKQNIDIDGKTPDSSPNFTGATVYSVSSSNECQGYGSNTENAESDSYVHEDVDGDGYCDLCNSKIDGGSAQLLGYTLTLDGSIGVNFYMDLSDDIVNDADSYVKFKVNGKEQIVKVSEATKDSGYYVFPCYVPAPEMTKEITAQVFSGDFESTVYKFTVQDYAKYILDNKGDYSAETVALVKALLNYGTMAQKYFEVNTDKLANSILADTDKAISDVAVDDLANYKPYFDENIDEVGEFKTFYLTLNSTTNLNVTFKPVEGKTIDDYSFMVDNKVLTDDEVKDIVKVLDDGRFLFTFKNIDAKNLGEKVIMSARLYDSTGEQLLYSEVGISPLSYARQIIKNSATKDANLVSTMKAMYDFYKKAIAYDGANS